MVSTVIAGQSLTIDRLSGLPLRGQIRDALSNMIMGGHLPVGTRLPSVRELAERLEVSTITVNHAYQDLVHNKMIIAEVGRGTSVVWPGAPLEDTIQDEGVEWRAPSLGNSLRAPRTAMLREILTTGSASGQLILTSSYPDLSSRLAQGFGRAMRAVATGNIEDFLRPESALGLPELRRVLANWLSAGQVSIQNGAIREDQVLVTSGEFTALRSIVTTFVDARDAVIVEHPTYFRALDLFEERGATLLLAPTDNQGIRTDVVANILRTRNPKLIYITHRLHNPSGVALHPDRQRALLALAAEHHVPIVEDDSGSSYWFDGHLPPSLLSMDKHGVVIHMGSLARIIAAGVRLGYIVTSGGLLERLAASIQAHDMWSTPFLQRAAAQYLCGSSFERDLRVTVNSAKDRRDAVLEALRAYAPDGIQWSTPVGGFNIWISFPGRIPPELLVEAGRRAGVVVLPDAMFLAGEPTITSLRLSYAPHEVEVLKEAIKRLCEAWRAVLSTPGGRWGITSGAIVA